MKTNGLLENSVAGLAEAGPGSATRLQVSFGRQRDPFCVFGGRISAACSRP